MQNTTALYQELTANGRHRKEIKFNISGVEYTQANIIQCKTSGALFERMDAPVGNCISRKISASIFPLGEIPRQAEIKLFIRAVLDGRSSEWIPQGVFFLSTRKKDKRTGRINVTGFDAMLKADAIWLTPDYAAVNFPMTQNEAVTDISRRIGVVVDPRSVLNEKYPVEYPVDEKGDLTMREVLAHIATSNAGNWVITEAGALRLIRYGDIPAETSYLVTETGDAITFGGVRILV